MSSEDSLSGTWCYSWCSVVSPLMSSCSTCYRPISHPALGSPSPPVCVVKH